MKAYKYNILHCLRRELFVWCAVKTDTPTDPEETRSMSMAEFRDMVKEVQLRAGVFTA